MSTETAKTVEFSTLFAIKSAGTVALQQMKTGTKIIREGHFMRVGLTMEKGKYFTSDRNSDAGTGVMFDIEESSLENPELTAGVLRFTAPRVEVTGRAVWVFAKLNEDGSVMNGIELYEDAAKTRPFLHAVLDTEQIYAQIKNVLSGKVQRQWSATKTDLKDLRK